LSKYFSKVDDNWRLAARLRRAVEFRASNLLDEAAQHGRFDVIFCRNVLVCFDPRRRRRWLGAGAPARAGRA
jgi:chemotaxis protein methyltransferase CheR